VDQLELYVVGARGGRPRAITRRGGPKLFALWPSDGEGVVYAGHFGKPGEWIRHDTAIYEAGVHGRRHRALTRALRNWPANMTASDTTQMGSCQPVAYTCGAEPRLAFGIQEQGASRIYSIPRGGGRPRLEFGVKDVAFGLAAARDGKAVVASTTISDAGDLYALTLDGSGTSRRLTQENAAFFRRVSCTEPEEVWFRRGRHRIHGWILKPPGFRSDRRYPMLLEIHGGPMAQYGYVFFHEMHLAAAAGYIVVFTNPHGSSGYGTPWMRAIDGGRWGTVDFDDLMAVVDTMARKRWVDARRMGVLGGSYGGFMTTHIIGRTTRFRAAVTERQAGNRLIHFGVSDVGWYAQHAVGAPPWEKPRAYLRQSPNYRAGHIRTPLLIVHSEQDHRCPIVEGEELFTFLKVQGKVVEMVTFEGESHGLSRGGKPMNRAERLRRILDWFDRHL
jgi:dipeptidyl aminopeptidase/acylaminoacyl peptidase